MSQAAIFDFPVELAQHILAFCHPWDVAAFSKTCRAAYALVYLSTDQYLWRHLFLAHSFDPPRIVAAAHRSHSVMCRVSVVDWKSELTGRMKIELALFRGPVTAAERKCALETLVTVIEESSLAVHQKGSSSNIAWLKRIIRQSLLLHNLYCISSVEEEDAQLHAQLRAYLALTIDHRLDKKTLTTMQSARDLSRAYVYDLRHYNAQNKWGPYTANGGVNWIHVEHLINVVALNIRELPGSWALTRPHSCIDPPRMPSTLTTGQVSTTDWAGVEGTWRRYVCFMDYRDLFAFNFTDLADGPRHPKFFKDPRFREATRLIEVKIHLVPTKQMRVHRSSELQADENAPYPPLCFTGSSKGVNGNEAEVEGYVLMGKDGAVRWQLTSIYDGQPQWSSSGVQIGGLGSAMGVVGVWTTTLHDQDDPVGPFWLWKVEDNSPTHLMEYT